MCMIFYSDSVDLVVDNLIPYTMYEFAVRAEIGDILGEYSNPTRLRTPEGSKSSLPSRSSILKILF